MPCFFLSFSMKFRKLCDFWVFFCRNYYRIWRREKGEEVDGTESQPTILSPRSLLLLPSTYSSDWIYLDELSEFLSFRLKMSNFAKGSIFYWNSSLAKSPPVSTYASLLIVVLLWTLVKYLLTWQTPINNFTPTCRHIYIQTRDDRTTLRRQSFVEIFPIWKWWKTLCMFLLPYQRIWPGQTAVTRSLARAQRVGR